MKSLVSCGLALAFLIACDSPKQEKQVEKTVVTKTSESMDPLLRHVVLFKFKDDASESDVQGVVDAFLELPNKIEAIQDIEWGTNNSPEGLSQGFTHCFFLTFASEAARDEYLPHPDHKAFGVVLGPHLDKVLVVDYWAKKEP